MMGITLMAEPQTDPPPYEALGRRIRLYRERAGYSQRGLADLVGKSPGYFPKVEAGESVPRPATLRRIARTLRVDYTELAILAGYVDPGPADVQVIGQSERAGLLRQFAALTMDELRRLNDMRRLAFSYEEMGDLADQRATEERRRVRREEEGDEEPPQSSGLANS